MFPKSAGWTIWNVNLRNVIITSTNKQTNENKAKHRTWITQSTQSKNLGTFSCFYVNRFICLCVYTFYFSANPLDEEIIVIGQMEKFFQTQLLSISMGSRWAWFFWHTISICISTLFNRLSNLRYKTKWNSKVNETTLQVYEM